MVGKTSLVSSVQFPSAQVPTQVSSQRSKRGISFINSLRSSLYQGNRSNSSTNLSVELSRLLIAEDAIYNSDCFFKLNGKDYPILFRLHRFFMCETATSVPSEALFSITGIILNEQKNNLNPLTKESMSIVENIL